MDVCRKIEWGLLDSRLDSRNQVEVGFSHGSDQRVSNAGKRVEFEEEKKWEFPLEMMCLQVCDLR